MKEKIKDQNKKEGEVISVNVLGINEQVLRGVDGEFVHVEIGVHPRREIRHAVVHRRQSLEHEMPAVSHRVVPKTKEHEQVPGRSSEAKDAVVAADGVPRCVLPGRLVSSQQLHAFGQIHVRRNVVDQPGSSQ